MEKTNLTKYKFFLPFSYYKKRINQNYEKKEIRIYRNFLELLDKNLKEQNIDAIKKILAMRGGRKTLNEKTLIDCFELIELYREPETIPSHEIIPPKNLGRRISFLLKKIQNIRISSGAVAFLSKAYHYRIMMACQKIENYFLNSPRRVLHLNDFTKIFEKPSYFLI
jgi:hypothetical protein